MSVFWKGLSTTDRALNVAGAILLFSLLGALVFFTSPWMLVPMVLGAIGGWATGTSGEPKPYG